MRISDWSSDVGSADLHCSGVANDMANSQISGSVRLGQDKKRDIYTVLHGMRHSAQNTQSAGAYIRSEERRVGPECVGTCISRWSPYPQKQTTPIKTEIQISSPNTEYTTQTIHL